MADEVKKEIELEIAHVLFTDIVGYSKLPIHQQRAAIDRLNDIVRCTEEFQAAEASGRLIKIPTGDGDHAGAQESWLQARSELEPFLKEQPENYTLIGDLALINMCLGDKAAALALSERAIAANPIEKDAVTGPIPIEILARVAARMGEPDRAIAALEKLLSAPGNGALIQSPLTPALLRLDPMFDPLRNDPRFQKLAARAAPK